MERLFLAVPLTEEVRREIGSELEVAEIELPGRRVAPENWHFTLRFLGDTPAERREQLLREMGSANLGPAFTVGFGGLGAFPRARSARVLWLGVEQGALEMGALARSAEDAVRGAGFQAEDKPFRAHLTLSRIQPTRSVADLLGKELNVRVQMPVNEVVLYRSLLGRGPARYEALARFPLAKEMD